MVTRVANRAGFAVRLWCGGRPLLCCARLQRFIEGGKRRFAGKVKARRIFSFRAEQAVRGCNAIVACAGNGIGLDDRDRVLQQGIHRHGRIGNAVDEGRIRTVFQQTADKIGQQRLMGTDGGIEPAGPVELLFADDFAVKRLAHAVQALELVVAGFEVRAGEMVDRRHGLRVVGRKLREDDVARGEQLAGAGNVGDIGVHFPGKDREVFQSFHLRALDFRVPIGALDETHHDTAARTAGKIDDVIQNEGAATTIGLHDETEAIPACEVLVERQFFQKVE